MTAGKDESMAGKNVGVTLLLLPNSKAVIVVHCYFANLT